MATRAKAAAPKAPVKKVEARFADTGADPDEAAAIAEFALRPSVNAAVVVSEYGKAMGPLDMTALIDTLADGIRTVNDGDMSRVEAMLFAQAQALQSMFMAFSRRALTQEYQRNLESFFRLSLKAQSQCRATLETLAAIKNPPVVFARQANINNGGQQQVNNGATPAHAANAAQAPAGAHAGGSDSAQTGLLGSASSADILEPRPVGVACGR